MIFSQKNYKAFTLIELLVVIAIIGILATIVIVNVNSARTKGKDKSIITSMNSLRAGGEMWANDHNGSYSGYCVNNDCGNGSDDWTKACTSIKVQNGNASITCRINTQNTVWCATTSLPGGGVYCVDSINNGKIITSDPGTRYICP